MRISLNNIKAIDDYISGQMAQGDALLFEVNMLLNNNLINEMQDQQNAYAIIRQYSRQRIKDEIVIVQKTLAAAPQHQSFIKRISNLFNNI
jgi:hypothetical protein